MNTVWESLRTSVPIIFTFGYEMIFVNEEEEEIIRVLDKVKHFAEETVPRFTDRQFKQHFRMNPDTFEDLLKKLHNIRPIVQDTGPGHPELQLEKQTMISLWYMANMESLRSVADRFGISKSTCWKSVYKIGKNIQEVNNIHKIICWPSQERANNIAVQFKSINGFPGVIGCIDGSHIRIKPPKNYPNSYYNRKKFHSVLMQGVCDDRKLFTDIYVGEPGSIHDQRLLQKSGLLDEIDTEHIEIPDNSHLVGDLAYTLHMSLLVGFKNHGNLTERQINFNQKLSQIRITIEHAFALLKGRFRRLKYMETVNLDLICVLISASCVLHNICILNGDSPEDIINVDEEMAEERRDNEAIDQGEQINVNCQIKRNNVVNSLRLR